MKKQITLSMLLAAALVSAPSFSFQNEQSSDLNELDIKFGGWSTHTPSSGLASESFNKNHLGLGVAYYPFASKNSNHKLGGEVWYMKDIFDNPSLSVMASYKYRLDVNYLIDSIDLGFNVGIINDTERTYTTSNGKFVGYSDERVSRIAATPQLTVNVTEAMHVDINYTKHDGCSSLGKDCDSLFFRLGYKFKI